MRKLLFFAIVLLCLATVLGWGQNTGLTSLQNDFSFGVFWNELDVAVNVGNIGFLAPEMSSDYIFAGLGNLNQSANISTFLSSVVSPMFLGFYNMGERPWSLFGGFHHSDAGPAAGSTTAYTPSGPIVVGAQTYYYNTQVVTTDFRTPIYGNIEDGVQLLMDMGAINLGASLWVSLSDSTVSTANFTEVQTNNYDTTPAAAPTETLDWTRTTEEKDLSDGLGGPGIDNMLLVGVPIYFKGMNAVADLQAGFGWWDASTTQSITYTVPASSGTIPPFAAGTFTDTVQNDTVWRGSTIPLSADFSMGMNPIFDNNPNNKLLVGVGAYAAFDSMTSSDVLITQSYTFVPAGAATATARNWDTDDYAFGLTADFGVDAALGHSLYLEPASGVVVGFVPSLLVAYDYMPAGVKVSGQTTVNRTDGDADGAFTSAADSVATSTVTYYDTMMNTAGALIDASADNVLTIGVALPSALKFQVADWFGITLGAQPRASVAFTFTRSTGQTSQTTTGTVDGTGATVVAAATVNPQTGDVTNTNTTNWTFAVDHNVGAQIGIPGGIMLYVDVAAAVAGGVWDFRNLTVQGVIPLPAR